MTALTTACKSQAPQEELFESHLKIIKRYHKEARLCGENGLYIAGIVMYGATLEVTLSTFCISQLEKHQCPSTNTLRETTLYEYIDTFSLSGIISKKTAHHIRKLRNLIHPNAYHNHLRKHKRGICKKDFERVEKYYSKITDDLLQNI